MKVQIPRRALLAAGPLALGACARAEQGYFGNTDPPRTQRLVYLLDHEPGSLDPTLAAPRQDELILSLFEGLTSLHPATGAPMAALATHFDVASDGLRYTFCLRGHPEPRGHRLPTTSDLPMEYSRGRKAPPDHGPARWSDGVPIQAHDIVYSWRRAVDPSTAAEWAFLMRDVQNAEEITAGKLPPAKLGVRARDDFTVEMDLRNRAPFFLELVSGRIFCPVPQHAIQTHGRRWTEPGRIVTSGPFVLADRRPYDRIVLKTNPQYYEAQQVALNELVFLVVPDPTPRLNLYMAGIGAVTQPWIPTIMPTLRRKKDFRPQPNYNSAFWLINATTFPLNDVRLRYALNMATDKRPLADLAGAGSFPATSLVPPSNGYPSLRSLPVSIGGTTYDVLSYNPRAAREILAKAAHPFPARLEYVCANMPDSKLWAQILKEQWKANLGVKLSIVVQELQIWVQSVQSRNFRHLTWWGSGDCGYLDPSWFLELFSGSEGYYTGWSDSRYNEMVSQARAIADPGLRMTKLAECERRLLEAMPILPMSYDVQPKLQKPFVRGLGSNLLNREQLKYVWIDTNWRPS